MPGVYAVIALCFAAIPCASAFLWPSNLGSLTLLSRRSNFDSVKSKASIWRGVPHASIHQSRMSSTSSSSEKEQCDGPARSGAIGNIDTSTIKPKRSEEEISTDGIIKLTDNAVKQLKLLKGSRGDVELVLRVGVRSGGCSGMSYVMEFEDSSKINPLDTELTFDDCRVVVDPKSLMFIFGMTLDYSDQLIGGGFKFSNPNAASTCGCGQSFGA